MQDLNILMITASVRQGRQSPKVTEALAPLFEAQPHTHVDVLDLHALQLPMFTDAEPTGSARMLLDAYIKADGIVIVTPEYNHSLPSALKNAIDYARAKELYGKPVAGVGVSNGSYGGVRALKELAHVWQGVRGISLPVFLPTPLVEEFDPKNPPEGWLKNAQLFVDQSVYWFRVIKEGKAIVQ